MPEDLLTVAQAAALLHVEPQDIWRRIEQGSLRASTLLTANGTSYLLERAVLFPEEQRGEEDRGQVVVRETEDGSSEVPALQSPDQQARLEESVRRLLDPLDSRLQAAERSLRQEIAQRAEAMAGLRRRAEEAERRLGDTQQELSQHSAAGAEYERARQATEQLRRQVKQLEQDGAALTERLNDFQ